MAEFIDAHGNLLKADVEALANSVNTVGVMGKGIALQFKNAFPANFEAYEAACNKQAVRLGEVFVFDNGRLTTPRWIIYFPTIRRSTTAPNADNLRHVLKSLEGHQLEGFGDGSKKVREAEPITVLPGGAREASEALAENHRIAQRIQRVLELVEGYESAYGLELLASVHWIAARKGNVDDLSGVTKRVQSWSQRKQRMFTAQHIESAWQRLHDHGWLATAA